MKENLEEISVFLGKNCVFEGKMTFEGVFRLDGKVEGEIFRSGTLIISETAVIKGKVEVDVLILNGMVEGEVVAKERVEVRSKGKLYGTVFTPVLVIQDGGILEGNCKMGSNPEDRNHREGTEKKGSALINSQ
jgi:cytoskeletal protein CcmA (bactofilin family)